MIDENDCDALFREMMEYFEDYHARQREQAERKYGSDLIYMFINSRREPVKYDCTNMRVVAYRYLERIVRKIAEHFGHVPPLVAVHHSHRQEAFYVDVFGREPTIVVSVEELTNHPAGAIWTCLHEYMHYVQRLVAGYLVPINGNILYYLYKWKGKEVRINLLETEHHMLPWEAEADAFANANVGFFLNEFGYEPEQFKQSAPLRDSKYADLRVRPNFNVECKQPEFWYYNTEKSG